MFVLSVASSSAVSKRAEDLSNVSITVPGLNVVDRRQVVNARLHHFSKSLDSSAFNNQLSALVSKRDAATPLYLAYSCEYLRMFGRFDLVGILSRTAQVLYTILYTTMGACCFTVELSNQSTSSVTARLVGFHYQINGVQIWQLFDFLCGIVHIFVP